MGARPAILRVDRCAQGYEILWLATAAALVALAVHGTTDAGLYSSRAVPVLFLPLGIAFGGARSASRPGSLRLAELALIIGVPLLALCLLPGVRSAFQADLAAVAQARAELAAYHWPDVPIQDALRRSPQVDLGPTLAGYRAALALDPANAAANRRLGQIELSQGAHDAARQHLEAAYSAAPGQRATRLLLGESYAVAGDVTGAAALWATVTPAPGHFASREWWYRYLGQPQRAGAIRQAQAMAGQ